MNGRNFDRSALAVEHGGVDLMLFWHAIAAIRTPGPASNRDSRP
jgi:hypothetical protein